MSNAITTPAITTLPLDQLLLSDLNVRQTERDADVASLAEDIAARGLKQNLVVTPAHFSTAETEDNFGDRFEVIAGGRRYQAMQLLVADGRLPHDHPVPVLVEARKDASETSLSENLHRVAMNPADEFLAFAAIVAEQERLCSDNPSAVQYTARRFGVTVKHVEGRLRLANLAPEILQALRENVITLESAKAYAGSADHDLQRKVFAAQAKSNWKPHDPATVRQELRGQTFSLDHPLMKFVGLDAYRAAGGRTETELFMGTEGEERGLDLKLLDKLAKAKAEPLVAPQAKADGFKSGLLATSGYGYAAKLPKAPEGMVRHERWQGELAKTAKKKAIGVYAIDQAGAGIEQVGTFKPEPKATPRDERDWEAERAAAARERAIRIKAARMAAGTFAGTPLEGRAFWPKYGCAPIEGCDDDHTFVAIQIRVPDADIEARRAEAEAAYEAELAAAAEKEQRDAEAFENGEPIDEDDADGDGEEYEEEAAQ